MTRGISGCLAAAVLLAGSAFGQINYKAAFGGVKFSNPMAMAEMPGKPGTFAVAEKGSGTVWLVSKTGADWAKTEFYKIPGGVYQSLEQGLLGVTFHPDYAAN